MEDFLQQGDNFELPSNFPQPKNVIEEQLNVLKSLYKNSHQTAKSSDNSKSNTLNAVSSSSNSQNKEIFKKREKSTIFIPNTSTVKIASGSMKEKLELAAPYNIFFTKVPDAPMTVTDEHSISFSGVQSLSYCNKL